MKTKRGKKRSTSLASLLKAGFEEPTEEQLTLLRERGESIYLSHRSKLEREHWGAYVAIEVESKKVYVGPDIDAALEKAQASHPERVFYFRTIGRLSRFRA